MPEQRPTDAPSAHLMTALVEQLLAHQRSDCTADIQSILREIEAQTPGALAQMQAGLQARRIRPEERH